MKESNWKHPNYRGYVSIVCNDETCGKTLISPANRFKRNKYNEILCPECYQPAKVYALPSEEKMCPVCREYFGTTNPSRKYCGKDCANEIKELRKEANKIRKGKKRKRAVSEINDFLNG